MQNLKSFRLRWLFCLLLLLLVIPCSFAQENKDAAKPESNIETKPQIKQQVKEEVKEEAVLEPTALPETPPPPPKPDCEFTLDLASKTTALPKIFSPSIDLSGRGHHKDQNWPYHLAAEQVLERWQKEVGFSKGIYRLRWNLWEANPTKKTDQLRKSQIIANYEALIKEISDSGGTVLLSLYGTPPGMGRALDKRSSPSNFKQWKLLVKNTMRYLSCEKKYNIWYEVWDTPDSEDFFLGLKKDYLNLYRFTAEAVRELEREKHMQIPLGGPSVSWWFQNFDGNNIFSPEQSLVYELIKFCAQQKLPLDFISWHAYSTDPYAENEATTYNKSPSQLIRDWLTFFRLNKNMPLVIDEWNYDSGANLTEERSSKAYICASYIPGRLKNMYEAGIDYQVFFSLEDFQNEREEINNNRGVFSYEPKAANYKGAPKPIYNLFMMLNLLGEGLYKSVNLNDECLNLIATKKQEEVAMLIWNYIDPYPERSFLSRSIALIGEKGRSSLVSLIEEGKLNKIFSQELSLDTLSLPDKLKTLLKKCIELKTRSQELANKPINLQINLSNIEGDYSYQRYAIDNSCALDCAFTPIEEKELTNIEKTYQESITLCPYSVQLIILKKKPVPAAEVPKQE